MSSPAIKPDVSSHRAVALLFPAPFSLKLSGFRDHRPIRNRLFNILLNFSRFLLTLEMFPSHLRYHATAETRSSSFREVSREPTDICTNEQVATSIYIYIQGV